MNKPYILAVCPNAADATAYYRAVWPLARLAQEKLITFDVVSEENWPLASKADIIFLQRPLTVGHKVIAQDAKLWGKALWVDYDDYLFDVPETNPAHKVYNQPKVQETMKYCLELADVVTVSTEPLKRFLTQYNENIVVVPNGIDLKLFDYRDVNWDARKTLVAWRGGGTHEKDVATVIEPLLELSKERANWKFLFFGHHFSMIEMLMPKDKYLYMGKYAVPTFMKSLHTVQAPIHIVPLEFNDFNECKSNITYLEATWAGSAVVAPDMPEWRLPGVILYKDPKGFKASVEHLMDNPQVMKESNEAAWKHVVDNFSLEVVNKIRMNVIRCLQGYRK